MSPKKQKKRKRESGRAAPPRSSPPVPAAVARRDLRRAAPWAALALVWAAGTPLFLLFYLAEGFAAMAQEQVGPQELGAMRRYLAGLVVCAVAVPLGGAAAALWLGRRVIAGLFAAALAVSAAGVLWLAGGPAELAAALFTAQNR